MEIGIVILLEFLDLDLGLQRLLQLLVTEPFDNIFDLFIHQDIVSFQVSFLVDRETLLQEARDFHICSYFFDYLDIADSLYI